MAKSDWLELPIIDEKGWVESSQHAQLKQPERKVATINDIQKLRQRILEVKLDLGSADSIRGIMHTFFEEYALSPEQHVVIKDWVEKQLAQLIDF